MRHRETYVRPDTPKRQPARAGTMVGAVVSVGLLAGVSTVVGSAVASPITPGPTTTATVPESSVERRLAALDRRLQKVERRLAWIGAAASGEARPSRSRPHATPPPAVTAQPSESAAAPSSTPATAPPATTSASSTPFPSASPSPSPSTTAASAAPEAAQKATAPPTATTPAAPLRSADSAAAATAAGTAERLFSAQSPWNTPIATNAASDPASGQIVSQVLDNRSLVVNLNLYEFGVPFYTATASTPRVTVNGAAEIGPVPLDPSWRPNNGADHKLNVIDPATGTVFELQGYDPGSRSVQWAVKKDYRTSLADGYPADGRAGPTGSGLTQAGGVIRMAEMKAGKIDHALSFITSRPVNRFRYPASHTDGQNGGIGLEEGMRVQLDPSVDVDAIPGITPGEKAIAKALQKYGAYCTDHGGGNNQAMGFYVETPKPGDANPYPAAGFTEDWAQLPHIPRDKLRVLAADATPRPN